MRTAPQKIQKPHGVKDLRQNIEQKESEYDSFGNY